MIVDIDRLDRETEVIFCAVSESAQDWMNDQKKFRPEGAFIIFLVPEENAAMAEFVAGAKRRGLNVRNLEE